MKKGFVYKWINTVNSKWYIGSHEGTPTDGYTASGKLIKKAFNKYGMEKFKREVLYEGANFREEEEKLLLYYDAENDIKSYNLKNSAVGGGNKSDQQRKHLSIVHTGKTLDIGTKNKIGKSVAKALKGRKLSEEHKNNLSSERRERAFNRNGYLLAIDPVTGEIQYKFLSPAEAKEHGYDGGSIGASMKYGWKHKGFIWKYEKK